MLELESKNLQEKDAVKKTNKDISLLEKKQKTARCNSCIRNYMEEMQ